MSYADIGTESCTLIYDKGCSNYSYMNSFNIDISIVLFIHCGITEMIFPPFFWNNKEIVEKNNVDDVDTEFRITYCFPDVSFEVEFLPCGPTKLKCISVYI